MTIDKVIVSNLSNKDFSRFAGVAVDNELEFWTAEALIDELSLCLAKVKQIVDTDCQTKSSIYHLHF